MPKLSKFILYMVVFILSSISGAAFANDDVETFLFGCDPGDNYDLDLVFAPVEKLPKAQVLKEKWSYSYINKNVIKYTDEQKILPSNKALEVDLVSTLKKGSFLEEGYLWHVIAYPKIRGWNYGGHWVIDKNKSLIDYKKIDLNSRKAMKSLSLYKGREPVFSDVPIRNIGDNLKLSNAWEKVFGTTIVDELVEPNNTKIKNSAGAYSFNFYYVPVPNPAVINTDGYRWVSSKNINRKGLVYGFILNPEGECLKWTSIKIVK